MEKTKFEIHGFCEAFYIASMLFLTESALHSVATANGILEKAAGSGEAIRWDRLLNLVQNVVVQGAALSRYFWPVRKEHEGRGEILRKAFGITDSSPLKSRDLRNEIEHFDEKLDIYLTDGIYGVILPNYVGPLPKSGGVTSHLFRAFYTDKAIFEILGKRYELNPLTEEINRIHELLEKAQSHGSRFPN